MPLPCKRCGGETFNHYHQVLCRKCTQCQSCECCPCEQIGCPDCPAGGRREGEDSLDYFARRMFGEETQDGK
jgi:hypothetical protein